MICTQYHIRYVIRHDTMQCYCLSDSSYIHAGHVVPGCPLSFSLGAVGRFRPVDRFWYDWGWWCLVCSTSTVFFVQPVPYWTDGRQGLSCGGFTGVHQHIWAKFSYPKQLHAEEWDSHAVQAGCLLASNSICLPGGKRSWPCPTHAMLPEREHSQHYSSFLTACCSSRRSSRFQARQQDRQQAFRGQHLDVALWESVPQEDLSGGCWRDEAQACTRIKTERGWNLKAKNTGCLRKAGRINFTVGCYTISYTIS